MATPIFTASTILSKAKGQESVPKRQGTPKINIKGDKDYDPTRPEGALLYKTADDLYYPDRSYDKKTKIVTLRTADGKKVTYNIDDPKQRERYEPVQKVNKKTGEVTYTNKDGDITYRTKMRKEETTKMGATDDARTLVSEAKHPMEMAYADYANSMKAMGNQARKAYMSTGKVQYDRHAKEVYREEVASLDAKLNTALLNATREREAQRRANYEVSVKQQSNPDMKPGDIKKAGQQALTANRNAVGSVSRRDREIEITDREWEAIQAGAISENKLIKILNNSNADSLRERAMPKTTNTLSTAKVNTIKAMSASNYTIEQIAKKLGVSTSTVSKYLKGA
jgi:DNA-binding NarL/FixJ family response regulator